MDTRSHLAKPGKRFRLKDHDPADTGQFRDRSEADGLLGQGVEKLASLQDKLYAQDRWGMLLIFQAMDAAGKDSVIKHVLSR
jgi:polyphosphate kinase 2 (PPK2 family)